MTVEPPTQSTVYEKARGERVHGPFSSRRARSIALRFALLLIGYLAWGTVALILVRVGAYSGQSQIAIHGHMIQVAHPSFSVYQVNPGPVRIILGLLAGALLVSTASVLWRVVRRSDRVGVSAMVVAGIAGVMTLLGILTVGPLIAPMAVLFVVLALPIAPDHLAPPIPATGLHPAGWYRDPAGARSWRYWDGNVWTEHSALWPPIE